MAGGVDIALGGPRGYPQETVAQVFLNASGKRDLDPGDIDEALAVFTRACFATWVLVFVFAVLF